MKFLTKAKNWVKREYIIDSIVIDNLFFLNILIWMAP